jgi:hypothetical protein
MKQPNYTELHPRFAWMRDYLAKVAPPGQLAGRQHIDPVALRAILPFVNLVDVERPSADELRFRYRLMGTLQTTAAGREISGKYLDDVIAPNYRERIRANMTTAATQRLAVYDRFPMPFADRDFIDSERVYFPLAKDGSTVDMLLIVNSYPDDDHQQPENNRTEPHHPSVGTRSAQRDRY